MQLGLLARVARSCFFSPEAACGFWGANLDAASLVFSSHPFQKTRPCKTLQVLLIAFVDFGLETLPIQESSWTPLAVPKGRTFAESLPAIDSSLLKKGRSAKLRHLLFFFHVWDFVGAPINSTQGT